MSQPSIIYVTEQVSVTSKLTSTPTQSIVVQTIVPTNSNSNSQANSSTLGVGWVVSFIFIALFAIAFTLLCVLFILWRRKRRVRPVHAESVRPESAYYELTKPSRTYRREPNRDRLSIGFGGQQY